MNKTLFSVLLFLCVNLTVNAQLEVKQTSEPTIIWEAKLLSQSIDAHIVESDTTYFYTFKDSQYTQIIEIESIAFHNRAELVQFLNLAKQVASDGKPIETERYKLSNFNKRATRVTIPGTSKFTIINIKHISKIETALAEFN